jgi:predicted O-methyltransferase YrrM
MLFSADDEVGRPSLWLIDIALSAARAASGIDLSSLARRMKSPPYFCDIWPGEHYKFLAALVQLLSPKRIIEIGTATGLSALAMKSYLPPSGHLITFDIVSWTSFPDTVLTSSDFADGSLLQSNVDPSDPIICRELENELSLAELIFFDAAKDAVTERRLIENFRKIKFVRTPLVVFDDIRLWNMLEIWREVTAPKLDVTSFGHWSGTGLVEWRW